LELERHYQARAWRVEAKVRAPVYETAVYPYGSQSPSNRVVAYLGPGERPEVLAVDFGKEWPSWEIRLPSGQRGFLFAPDIIAER
jgi:hypothetical protein